VMSGSKSPPWMRNSAQALAELLGARHRTLDGQTHMVKPDALSPVLTAYFDGRPQTAHGARGRSDA